MSAGFHTAMWAGVLAVSLVVIAVLLISCVYWLIKGRKG